MNLQDVFYVVSIIFMVMFIILFVAIVIILYVIKKKISQIHMQFGKKFNIVKHAVDIGSSVADRTIFKISNLFKDLTAKSK